MNAPAPETRVVHVLSDGVALCNIFGAPALWPRDHVWVSLREAEHATCFGCRDVLACGTQTAMATCRACGRWRPAGQVGTHRYPFMLDLEGARAVVSVTYCRDRPECAWQANLIGNEYFHTLAKLQKTTPAEESQ